LQVIMTLMQLHMACGVNTGYIFMIFRHKGTADMVLYTLLMLLQLSDYTFMLLGKALLVYYSIV